MSANPVYSMLSGPIGTSTWAWPSSARGTLPMPAKALTVLDGSPPAEKNGFTIIDVEPDAITFRLFAWREPQQVEEIARLEPFQTLRIARPVTVHERSRTRAAPGST